ncbi:MDR family MFS transporter [Propionibacterium freudenreichii]|uniref:MDR family MFS transporter n=1 Tax=Propionibacterium freudenreichii TaxID=1744 RepID=UPI00254B5BEE|nr:MDR family MFS transporter [Propionibacterium freudenreichii]
MSQDSAAGRSSAGHSSSPTDVGDDGARPHPNRGIVMAAVFIATFMTSVEVTIVTTALPTIISELHGLSLQSWIMSAYLLTTAITTPIYGKLADSLGRKRIFQFGVVLFTVGSLLSGLSPSIGMMIGFRALQGIGAGAVMPLTFTIIADYYSFAERARIIAFNNTAWGLSALIGPLLGGFLVDALSWHWVFFVNVPLGAAVLVLVAWGYKEKRQPAHGLRPDWAGIWWLTLCLVCLLLAVQDLDVRPLVSGALFVVAVVAALMLVRVERRSADPLIAPAMFARPTFTVQIVTATILSGVLIGYQTYVPMWLQSLYHRPPTIAGLVVTPSSIMWLTGSFFVGGLISRFVPKRIAVVFIAVLLVGYGALAVAPAGFPVWAFYVFAAVNGTGMGIVISMNNVLTQHLVDPSMVGSATGIFTLGRSLGPTLMAGIYGAVLNVAIRVQLRGQQAVGAGVDFGQVNTVISSSGGAGSSVDRAVVDPILLNSFHALFGVVVVILVVALLINVFDPNKKVIR